MVPLPAAPSVVAEAYCPAPAPVTTTPQSCLEQGQIRRLSAIQSHSRLAAGKGCWWTKVKIV